ncbi:MAG TPA: molybdopterin cofactor-binding domain-containing protein [Stellaceae bacterium]|jgi:CO/xanthine dehydrogenase Mo-binding subunit|nr:molybdopterin cofactor-binding domain-containing protein [Stellaceae bacterium]
MNDIMIPPLLQTNPRLDQWVEFTTPGRVTVSTGRVEIGQGVLTAMLQIAADELDVSPERIDLQTGDTDLTPNEGYTAGSQSMQYGGVALRLACAEVRGLMVQAAAVQLGAPAGELAVSDGTITRQGQPTGCDYWTLSGSLDLTATATASAKPKSAGHTTIGRNAPRVDLGGKVFGAPSFVHDMALDGMLHAHVIRQPRRTATVAAIDAAAIRRAGKGQVDILRDGNFVAVLGADETVVDAAAAVAPGHVSWDGLDPINPGQEEARWLLQRPSIDRNLGPEPVDPTPGQARYEASFTRMHIAHASVGPSSALALYKDGHLTVWSHTQGVYPLKAALAGTLKLDPAHISVKHAQGPGCYGHNGADDAAADAAVIAMRRPGVPIRVRWRREEEFGFEPVSPAMLTSVRAILDDQGRPVDWTTEIWSGRHSSRPGGGGNLLAAEALPDPPPAPPPADPPEANGGGGTRNGEPLYAFPAKRIVHHLVAETPVRTSSLRGLGATINVFAIESAMDELAERAGMDPVDYRLSVLTDPRAKAVVTHVAKMAAWRPGLPVGTGKGRGIGFAMYKNRAAYCAVVADVEVDKAVRVTDVWCAADAGLVINPDGALNQLEGGVIQGISWALKEGVRLDSAGISSRDWESYPVVRFSEVPEVYCELVGASADLPPLGIGEASGGPTVAAIGNAVAQALGARLRDLPLNRERIMAALLKS